MAILLAFMPIYLANVAFSKRFGASDDSRSAFGLNLLGAMLGGCLEYVALLTGYRNLLLLVAALYLLAFLLTPRALSGARVAGCSCRTGSPPGPRRVGRSRCGCPGRG